MFDVLKGRCNIDTPDEKAKRNNNTQNPNKNPEDTESIGQADLEKENLEKGRQGQVKDIKASE